MADIWDDDFEDDQPQNESELVKQLRKVIKDRNAEKKALEDELGTLRPRVRKTAVSEILNGLKVNPKIAGLIPSTVDANEESIKAWVDEYGDLFGAAPGPAGDGEQPEGEGSSNPETVVDQAAASQWNRIQTQESQSGVTTPDQESAQLAMLQAAATAAKGSPDLYFAYLSGEKPIPTS